MDFIKQGFLGKSDWWRYLVGTFIIFIGWQIIGAIPLMVVAFQNSDSIAELLASAERGFTTLGIDKNYLLALMLITGVFGVYTIIFVIKTLHKRTFLSVLSARKSFDWKRVFVGFSITALIALFSLYMSVQSGSEELIWNFKPTQFYTLVAVSFILFPFQTGTEEFFFRGYLMQWIGTGLNSRLIALLLTSIGFGLLHGANPEVDKLGPLVMIFYIGTGLFYGVTTLMDEGLELSFGMHTANNIMAALLISTDWTIIHTDALYIDYSEPEVVSIGFLMPVLVGYPIIVLLLGKIYKWSNWKEKLMGKVSNYKTDLDQLGNNNA